MATGSESIQGPRLAFVVRKLPGTVTRMKFRAPPTLKQREKDDTLDTITNTPVEVIEDAGFMVYLPTGSAYRLSAKEMVKSGFDQEPAILSFEQANDPKTAAGRFKLARTEAAKQKAWTDMENEVIKLCQGRFGNVDAMISNYDPRGVLPEVKLKETA